MSRYIDADKFLNTLENEGADVYDDFNQWDTMFGFSRDVINEAIKKTSIEDVEPIIKAYWNKDYIGIFSLDVCSNCGFERECLSEYKRCPNCGAHMDEKIGE